MAQNYSNPTPTDEQEPFIPPQFLLILSALGFIVALFVGLTQPEFGVIGYGGLAFGILALLMWVLLAPQQARAVVTGRTARFGGMSLLVTILLIVAMVFVYGVVKNASWRADLTQTDTFSLTDESRQAISAMATEPDTPKLLVTLFYGAAQASIRDQATLLLDDYVETSSGKIQYRFVDPDREPQTVNAYKVTSNGSIAVARLDEAGNPDTENANVIPSLTQQDLTNAILKTAAGGVFNAYFLTVQDGEGDQMTILKQILSSRLGWNVQDVSLAQLTSTGGEFNLDDPNVTGQVIVIPGGSAALSADELQVLEDYVNKGGDLVIFAGVNVPVDHPELAAADNLSDYLLQNFGLRFNNDIVLDPVQRFQTPLNPVATDLDTSNYITSNTGATPGQAVLVFSIPRSITIADTPPANVTVTPLVRSSASSFAKTDMEAILDNDVSQAETDAKGPLVLAAAAVNADTGAHVVLLGSTALANDQLAQSQSIDNLSVAFNSLIWSTDFYSYFTSINVQQQTRPQDTPIFADEQTLNNIRFITMVVLPFGVLGLGILVWWNNRERAR